MGELQIRWKKRFLNLMVVLLAIFSVFHFSVIVLHAGPINPISAKLQSQINAYVTPFFQQNWHLFAPNPVTTNFKLYVKVRYTEPGKNEIVESKWLDMVSPMLKKNEETLFSPYNRLIRLGSGYVHELKLGGHDELTYELLNTITDDSPLYDRIDEKMNKHIEDQKRMTYRYVSAYAKAAFPDKRVLSVQFMTGQQDAVPYSKRNDENYRVEEKFIIYEWREIDHDVLPFP
ncbi:DUF5819 family protein [Paenibacillus sp. 3LSP]|nr:DUF5819 family protein [Paenibacillus sp. 3LSP]